MDYETAWRQAEDGKRQLEKQKEELQLRVLDLESKICSFMRQIQEAQDVFDSLF